MELIGSYWCTLFSVLSLGAEAQPLPPTLILLLHLVPILEDPTIPFSLAQILATGAGRHYFDQ